MPTQSSAVQRESSGSASSGPEAEKKRRLAETDVDPSGDLPSSDSSGSGETESVSDTQRDNQPAESHEDASRDRNSGDRDTENPPKPGHEE